MRLELFLSIIYCHSGVDCVGLLSIFGGSVGVDRVSVLSGGVFSFFPSEELRWPPRVDRGQWSDLLFCGCPCYVIRDSAEAGSVTVLGR